MKDVLVRIRGREAFGREADAAARLVADLDGRLTGIYALPVRYEPFGLSILEAALSGCALVVGDFASLRETWGANAVYVPPDDHFALRSVLRDLAADAAARERLGRAARRRALQFTPQRMAQGYLRAYAALLEEATICA